MKNVLSDLYYGRLNEMERDTKKLQETNEYKQYDECYKKLTATFTEEQAKIFEEYFEWEAVYTGLVKERGYKNGVKLGIWLAFELMDFEPTT